MKKILSVVGARPQFIKSAPLSRSLRTTFVEVLVHTGQHYDDAMSTAFFRDLGIPLPDHNLGVGSGSHGLQTGTMLIALEKVVVQEKPDAMLVYGDTNSTLAGALCAAKLAVPLAHIEAGLRSFNKRMPEELNRVATDHVSDFLFCPTPTAVENLRREGITRNVFDVGDVMKDALLQNASKARLDGLVERKVLAREEVFYLLTLHRQENTQDLSRFLRIIDILAGVRAKVVFPVHPRTRKLITENNVQLPSQVIAIEPVGYLESIALQKNAAIVVTDSGGVQKEAYILGTPCITLRAETEWVETVDDGWNALVDIDAEKFASAERRYLKGKPGAQNSHYGDGDAAGHITKILSSAL